MLYLQIASPKSSVLNFLDSNSFEVIISIFQRTEKVPDMERLPYDIVQNYIEKAEETSRLLLLFLFGFISSIEIDGHIYSLEKKPHPIKPLRKAYFKFFPELAQYLYENDCIPDTNMNSLFHFLRTFVHLML